MLQAEEFELELESEDDTVVLKIYKKMGDTTTVWVRLLCTHRVGWSELYAA